MNPPRLVPLAARFAGALLLACAVGCTPGDQGYVSGKVLYKGNPLPGGLVTFVPSDKTKRAVAAEIDENGRYWAYLPLGDAQIMVDNRELQPPPVQAPGAVGPLLPPGVAKKIPTPEKAGEAKENPAAPKRPPGTYVAIHPDYYDVKTSKLHYSVRSGSQTFDIELTK